MQDRICVIHTANSEVFSEICRSHGRRRDGLIFDSMIRPAIGLEEWSRTRGGSRGPLHVCCELPSDHPDDDDLSLLATSAAKIINRQYANSHGDAVVIGASEFFRLLGGVAASQSSTSDTGSATFARLIQRACEHIPSLTGARLSNGTIRFSGHFAHPWKRLIDRRGSRSIAMNYLSVSISDLQGKILWNGFAVAQPEEGGDCEDSQQAETIYRITFEVPAYCMDGRVVCDVRCAPLAGEMIDDRLPPVFSGELVMPALHLLGWPSRALINVVVNGENIDVLQVQGNVMNVGTSTWQFRGEAKPLAIGLRLRAMVGAEKVTRVSEFRTAPDRDVVAPGEVASFHFQIPRNDLAPGRYEARIDLVADGRYWFEEVGGEAFKFVFKAPYPIAAFFRRRCSLPRVVVVIHSGSGGYTAPDQLPSEPVIVEQDHPDYQVWIADRGGIGNPGWSDGIERFRVRAGVDFDSVFSVALNRAGRADVVFVPSGLRVWESWLLSVLAEAAYSAPDVAAAIRLEDQDGGTAPGYAEFLTLDELNRLDDAVIYVRGDLADEFRDRTRCSLLFSDWLAMCHRSRYTFVRSPDAHITSVGTVTEGLDRIPQGVRSGHSSVLEEIDRTS